MDMGKNISKEQLKEELENRLSKGLNDEDIKKVTGGETLIDRKYCSFGIEFMVEDESREKQSIKARCSSLIHHDTGSGKFKEITNPCYGIFDHVVQFLFS